jgi:branched-chain amino acid transport system permease protein
MKRAILLGVLGTILVSLPAWVESRYAIHLLNITGVNVVLALGLLFVFGYCGQIALCQAAFFGVGAYTSALLTTTFGANPWLGMLAAASVSGLVGAVVGAAILRLRGHYFALASFGFGEIASQVFLNWKDVTRGTDGILDIPKPSIGGWTLSTGADFYYLIVVLVCILGVVAYRIRRSRYGRAFLAVRNDALASNVAGLNVLRVKLTAFVLSAAYAGIAGGIYAHMFSFVSPESFGFMVSVNVMAMVLVGGIAHIWGVFIGALILTLLPEMLRFLQEYYMVIYGAGLAALVIFMPDGISGVAQRWLLRTKSVIALRRA